MSKPVCTEGSRFVGFCAECEEMTSGELTQGIKWACIEGTPICVHGSQGRGDCGHDCQVVATSTTWFLDGKPVARAGDAVIGTITGVLMNGSDFVSCD